MGGGAGGSSDQEHRAEEGGKDMEGEAGQGAGVIHQPHQDWAYQMCLICTNLLYVAFVSFFRMTENFIYYYLLLH